MELALITTQVVRGTTSHFNFATPLDAFIFQRMRDFIVLVFTMGIVAAVLLLRQRLPDRVFAAALRGGIGLSLLGMAVAILMTVPLPMTRAAFAGAGGGAHSVGVADGGPGLPLVGWSTVGGDLRAAHFVGLHAMQLLPLLGWALSRRRFAGLGDGARLALVRIAGLAYLGLVLLLTWQALRGQSIVAPDGLTLAAAGALLAVTALAVMVTVAVGEVRRVSGSSATSSLTGFGGRLTVERPPLLGRSAITATALFCVDVQHRFAGVAAIEEFAGDGRDLGPGGFAVDMRGEATIGDQRGETRESLARRVARDLIEEDEAVEVHAADREEAPEVERHIAARRGAEVDDRATLWRLPHDRAEQLAADRVEDQVVLAHMPPSPRHHR